MSKPIVGGEYLFHQKMFDEPYLLSVLDTAQKYHPNYHHNLTGGGFFSLKAILKHLKEEGRIKKPVLLPSYLCPSILKPFRELNIDYQFYPVDRNLQPDIQAVESMITNPAGHVIMVIPYFGFRLEDETFRFFNWLRLSGTTVIEDRAQCLFPGFEPVGNFMFYSFRKFLPVDGSLLISDEELNIKYDHDNQHYTALKKFAQEQRYNFIHNDTGKEQDFLTALNNAETLYYSEGIANFEMTNLALFTRIDIPFEIVRRKEIFGLLSNKVIPPGLISNPDIGSSSPLCFPIKVQKRDKLSDILKINRIFAPIHWKITVDDVPPSFSESHDLAASIISLPVRSSMTEDDCDRIARIVNDFVSE